MSFRDEQLLRPIWPYQINHQSQQAQGLVGWWPSQPYGGEKLIDHVAGNHGSLVGASWAEGVRFDGTDDYVNCGDVLDMGLSDWTASCWFRTGSTGNQGLIVKSAFAGVANRWGLYYDSSAFQLIFHGSAGVNTSFSSTAFMNNQWHHAAGVWRRNGNQEIWINGILRASGSISSQSGVDLQSTYVLLFGRYNNTDGSAAGSNYPLNGQLDDIRVYRRALSAGEMWALWDQQTRYELYWSPWQRLWFIPPVAGPIVYEEDFAGSITPSGTLTKQVQKSHAGSVTPTGATAKQGQKALAGSVAPTGAAVKQANKVAAGSVTPTGAIAKLISKILSGSITPSAALDLVRVILRSFAGEVAPSGSITKQANKALAGSDAPAGTVAKSASKATAGVITPTGALATLRVLLRSFAGEIAPSGAITKSITKALTGSTTPTGTIGKLIAKAIAGVLAPAGALITSLVGVNTKVVCTLSTEEQVTVTLSTELGG